MCALQHEPAPRPLPLFLELVRKAGEADPDMARQALIGLRAYELAERPKPRAERPEVARIGGTCIRDHGGAGPPALLIPSLINPPHILDLDSETSLAQAATAMGRRVLLLDWGPAQARADFSVSGHIEHLLVPLLREIDEKPALVGYCLGGTMAIAAANLVPVERVATLAAPWHFSLYPDEARLALQKLWVASRDSAKALGALPMELLQAAFWSLDPTRTVAKFADFATLDPLSAKAERFIALEDWANQGEALPYSAAAELMEPIFADDQPGRGSWSVAGVTMTDGLACPLLNLTASEDRIAPAATAPHGPSQSIASGHVGMVVGSARAALHATLAAFLAPACR